MTFSKLGLMLIVLSMSLGCSGQVHMTELGAAHAKKTWVYLCGLTNDFNSEQETKNRHVLDQLGKRRGIKFLALHPFERCEKAGDQLCWRHYTAEETLQTYDNIMRSLENRKISGFIGFSNGGYFLNQLAQMQKLAWPIISIGAAGTLFNTSIHNRVTIIVGKNEVAYESARLLYRQAKGTPLSVTLTEHNGAHILPEHELESVLG